MNGCKDGNCELLFNSNLECEHRKKGKLFVCDMMGQEDGRCKCVKANKVKRRNGGASNNSFFRKRSDETFALLVAHKEAGHVKDILPYREW